MPRPLTLAEYKRVVERHKNEHLTNYTGDIRRLLGVLEEHNKDVPLGDRPKHWKQLKKYEAALERNLARLHECRDELKAIRASHRRLSVKLKTHVGAAISAAQGKATKQYAALTGELKGVELGLDPKGVERDLAWVRRLLPKFEYHAANLDEGE
jgi:hypothetical protein